MALHCAATLLLVPTGVRVEAALSAGAVLVEPLDAVGDVVEALSALADLHRGERVLVPVRPEHVAAVLEHLGHAPGPDREVVRLEVGDDGWSLPQPSALG